MSLVASISIYGQSAGNFARMGMGARGVAMGNALVADAFGDGHPYYNPALAPYISKQYLEATYSALTFDRNLQFLQIATPMQPNAGISAGIIHGGVTDIDGRDASGNHTENYSTDEYALFVSFGTQVGKRTSIGLRLTYYRANLFEYVQTASSIGLSFGTSIRVHKNLNIGFSVDDLLAKYAWDTSLLYGRDGKENIDKFPIRMRMGATYQSPNKKLLLSGEYESEAATLEHRTETREAFSGSTASTSIISNIEKLQIQSGEVKLGATYWLSEPIALRAGISGLGENALMPAIGFSLKQNLGELPLRFDYALKFEPYQTGMMHLLSLRLGL